MRKIMSLKIPFLHQNEPNKGRYRNAEWNVNYIRTKISLYDL